MNQLQSEERRPLVAGAGLEVVVEEVEGEADVAEGEADLSQGACKSYVRKARQSRLQHLKMSSQARMSEVCHRTRVRIVLYLSTYPRPGRLLQVWRMSRRWIYRAMMDRHLQPVGRRRVGQRAVRTTTRDRMLAFPKALAHQSPWAAAHLVLGASVLTYHQVQKQVLHLDQWI
jgi:hypothetical protein